MTCSPSASRAYCAVFHSAKAVPSKINLSSKTQRGVIRSFGERFIKTGMIEKTLGENLRRAKDVREKGDYLLYYKTPENVVETLIRNAEDFCASIKEKLEEL